MNDGYREGRLGGAMMTSGIDAYTQVHRAVALNATGQAIAAWRGVHTPAGWDEVLRGAEDLGQP